MEVVFLLLLHHVGKIGPAGSFKLNLGPIGGYVQAVPAGSQLTRQNSSSVLLLLIHIWAIHMSLRLYRGCPGLWRKMARSSRSLTVEEVWNFSYFLTCFKPVDPAVQSFFVIAILHLTHLAAQISPRFGALPVLVCFLQQQQQLFGLVYQFTLNLTQVWGPASFGLPPPATTMFSSIPTTCPQTTHASSKYSSSNCGRSTSNPQNSRSSSHQLGQSNGELDKNLELTNINPSNTCCVNCSSGNCSKELTANVTSTERKSWQTALLQSVSQQGEKPQWVNISCFSSNDHLFQLPHHLSSNYPCFFHVPPSSNGSRSTSNPHNSKLSCINSGDQLGQSNGDWWIGQTAS